MPLVVEHEVVDDAAPRADALDHLVRLGADDARIADFVANNGLAFVGFDLEPFTTRRYRARFPHDSAMTDLASWDAFEREHPGTFSGMYQFWVQRRS